VGEVNASSLIRRRPDFSRGVHAGGTGSFEGGLNEQGLSFSGAGGKKRIPEERKKPYTVKGIYFHY